MVIIMVKEWPQGHDKLKVVIDKLWIVKWQDQHDHVVILTIQKLSNLWLSPGGIVAGL
jgi:hypothetical protein